MEVQTSTKLSCDVPDHTHTHRPELALADHDRDVMDIIALTNSGINFILYCTMSRQFRITFKEIFLLPIMNQFAPSSQYANIDKTGEKTQISANASFLRTCEQEDIRI
ncbi:hypothetical protein HUJ05_008096 [Dendroctonus ponderosae]|nr:hypothetical protein HUJ05_008096 [Dendroctonus ponderosae]